MQDIIQQRVLEPGIHVYADDDATYVKDMSEADLEEYFKNPYAYIQDSSRAGSTFGLLSAMITTVQFDRPVPPGAVATLVAFRDTGMVTLFVRETLKNDHADEWERHAKSKRPNSGGVQKNVSHWSIIKGRTSGFFHCEFGKVDLSNPVFRHSLLGFVLHPASLMRRLDNSELPIYESSPTSPAGPLAFHPVAAIAGKNPVRSKPNVELRVLIQHAPVGSTLADPLPPVPVCLMTSFGATGSAPNYTFATGDVIIKMYAS